jgi:DNA-binding HxlR family transcriptional regulator
MLGIVGDEWTLLIVQQALLGERRYAGFRAALPISDAVLTTRLGQLTSLGLLERRAYAPARHEYALTACGRGLWPVLLGIWDWERTWVPGQVLPAIAHTGCGEEFRPLLACRACRAPVAARDVVGGWGPSGSWPRSVPVGTTRRRATSGLFPSSMAMFGNRWSAALLGAAFLGVRRFGGFATHLAVPPTVLAERLRTFTSIGVLTPMPDGEYHLTDKGRAFYPSIATAVQWAEHWFPAPEGPALSLVHGACGAPFVPDLHCDRCQERLTGRAVLRRHLETPVGCAPPR